MRAYLAAALLAVLISCSSSDAEQTDSSSAKPKAPPQTFMIGTEPEDVSYYPWITELTSGPIHWYDDPKDDEHYGEFYRLAITTAEIYHDLHVEKVTLGMAGCCKEVRWVREIALDALQEQAQWAPPPGDFQNVTWHSPHSVTLINRHEYYKEATVERTLEMRIDGLSEEHVEVTVQER